ncbi:MAG: RES domain-containing protein [Xenococcus sp. MO_188.B8]|nr:RES domain-containing protein [Xenococcus sp. MO_188.B8]
MVDVKPPPPLRNVNPQTVILTANTKLRRIFDPTRYNATAVGFRSYGPVSRFDHHDNEVPKEDDQRRIIYAGFSLSCCIAEYFGDGEIINVANVKLAVIYLSKDLKLLDLRGKAAMAAGTVAAISGITQRKITQSWGKYFYEHPELYGEVDGLIFSGAHNGENVIALYERSESVIHSSKVKLLDMASDALRSPIFRIAKEQGLDVETYL